MPKLMLWVVLLFVLAIVCAIAEQVLVPKDFKLDIVAALLFAFSLVFCIIGWRDI